MKLDVTSMILATTLGIAALASHADNLTRDEVKNEKSKIVLETLLNRSLEVTKNTDIIVDRVSLPPNTALGRRWHPGEMFVYVMEGSIAVVPDGAAEVVGNKGDVVEVPFKQVYAARTNSEGAKVLIFRVHEKGQPVRTKLE